VRGCTRGEANETEEVEQARDARGEQGKRCKRRAQGEHKESTRRAEGEREGSKITYPSGYEEDMGHESMATMMRLSMRAAI
jgi:hypothetical protein